MQPHQQRVITERDELADKTGKLNAFLSGAIFSGLDASEQARLVRQYAYMRLYPEVLNERIAAF